MQRYELIEGTSSKFWEVAVKGSDLVVCFGRIGTAGQSKTKNFDDAAAAAKERDKLVKEKTGKGYLPVGGAQDAKAAAPRAVSAAPPAKSVSPAPAAPAAPAAPTVELAPPAPAPQPAASAATAAVPSAAAIAAAQAIVWPSGGFQWDDSWRKALPIVRGIHAPAVESGRSLLSNLIVFSDGNPTWAQANLQVLANAAGRSWTYWDKDLSAQRITRENLSRPDFEYWLGLMAQARCIGWRDENLQWVVHLCCGLHGMPFALEVALALWEASLAGANTARDPKSLFVHLRRAIACADDAAYRAVLDAVQGMRTRSNARMLVCAYLFPHIAEWAVECVDQKLDDPHSLLAECMMPADVFARYLKSGQVYLYYLRPALYLQIHLHGEAAFEGLAVVLAKSLGSKDQTVEALELLNRMQVPQLVPLLVGGIENKEVRAALDKLATQFPAAVLKTAIESTLAGRDRSLEGWTVRLALREPGALADALAAIDEAGRGRFEAILAALQRADAPAEKLPALLREPPWLRNARQQELPTVETSPLPTEERLEWSEQELAQVEKYQAPPYVRKLKAETILRDSMWITPAGEQRLLQGKPLQPGDVEPRGHYSYCSPALVLACPEQSRLALWNSYPANLWYTWDDNDGAIPCVLAAFGPAAFPGMRAYLQTYPEKGFSIVARVDSPQFVEPALHALNKLKKAKEVAAEWIRKHPRTVLFHALPQAFHRNHSAARDNARHGLRWLAANGFEALAQEVAATYGETMTAALAALQGADPLLVLPGKMPKLPAFFVAASFRRPELPGGEALPLAAMEYLGTMLAISRLDAPYPGLEIVQQTCTRASLAEFAWDLFEAWMAAGAPSKEAWAFTALGLLGDDETARRLAPRIREWPGESAHARAVTGLDLLAAIGSDVALMHLNGIAGKVKFKALQERAKEKVAAVADARGFTPEELADRLVPDLSLDENGSLELDFGPRKFHVGFDETLKPFVKDAQGVRLKDLPKPLKSDDAALAEAAVERYKQMKKDAKAIASLQVIRLEMGMIARRRWSAADFRLFFLAHPLMRHMAARLVWGVYENGTLTQNFRVAEDWTLADADDALFALPESATVGISHILEMPKDALEAFGQIFADYEILQPFRQLGRETYGLTPDESKLSTLTRFKQKVVATGSVMGLVNRGWERGQAQDGGWVGEFNKYLGDEYQIDLQLDPGTVVGDMSYEPRQKLPAVTLRKRGTWDQSGEVAFDRLDPILVSEILRDLELLAPMKE